MAKINIKPEISDIKLSQIRPAPYNPREITNEALSGLRHSLEKFGYVDLLVVNKRNMHIISGHQRYKILQAEGVETAPAILVDVDEIQEQAMNVTLNNQEIAGVWTPFWSSTTCAPWMDGAWCMYPYDGYKTVWSKPWDMCYVRPVRGGQA